MKRKRIGSRKSNRIFMANSGIKKTNKHRLYRGGDRIV